jgi:hypothetical protein
MELGAVVAGALGRSVARSVGPRTWDDFISQDGSNALMLMLFFL